MKKTQQLLKKANKEYSCAWKINNKNPYIRIYHLKSRKTLLNNSNKPKLISQAIYNKASAPDKFGTMCLERPLRIFHNLPA